MSGIQKAIFFPLTIALATTMFLSSFFLIPDALARFVWNTFDAPIVTLRLIKKDASPALEISTCYFNGGTSDLAQAQRKFELAGYPQQGT